MPSPPDRARLILNRLDLFAAGLRSLRNSLDGNFFLRRRALKRLAAFFRGALLDLGVGQGPDTAFFKSLPGVASYTACDRREYHGVYANGYSAAGSIVLYEGDRLPFEEGSFDCIASLDCIEHIAPAEIARYLLEAHRVLRPSGHLVVAAPFAYPEHCAPFDYQRFSSFGLQQLLSDAGFTVVQVVGRGSALETMLFLVQHRFFVAALPSFIASQFIPSPTPRRVPDVIKVLLLPVTSLAYVFIACLIHVSALLRSAADDRSALSLGYIAVGRK